MALSFCVSIRRGDPASPRPFGPSRLLCTILCPCSYCHNLSLSALLQGSSHKTDGQEIMVGFATFSRMDGDPKAILHRSPLAVVFAESLRMEHWRWYASYPEARWIQDLKDTETSPVARNANTLTDYLHLTKALAHVSLSQLPFQMLVAPASFIFASNPNLPSILSSLTSIPQTTLAPYHRLFGRLVIIPLLCGHGILYLLFYVQSAHPVFGTLLAKRVQDLDVQCGLAGLATAVLVSIFGRSTLWQLRGWRWPSLSRAETRRRVFYIGHLVLVAGLLALAYSHVIYARAFVLEAIGASLANLAYCWLLAGARRM
jgi:hypothetical protein